MSENHYGIERRPGQGAPGRVRVPLAEHARLSKQQFTNLTAEYKQRIEELREEIHLLKEIIYPNISKLEFKWFVQWICPRCQTIGETISEDDDVICRNCRWEGSAKEASAERMETVSLEEFKKNV